MMSVAVLEAGSLEVLGSVASLGVAASLGRSLGSGNVVSEVAVSCCCVDASLELAVLEDVLLEDVLLEVTVLLVDVGGVTARGPNLSGVRDLASGCGALSEALGTRIGTARIGSRATLS